MMLNLPSVVVIPGAGKKNTKDELDWKKG